ncbi:MULTISPECIES: hypothetical protein [Roseomonadaceae]|uniref:Major facilitator superfamily (MFS) profile domain-containing protein n=1 Tax=Falsiroseomonas oleicola TaxID=2801474 RepID=A0ABS6HCF4_9PROT|nr:hypothetical protein [Roseomonas oleicola]MBU8546407.1 hypothetical protein [Roseomonas oleicola]
MWVWIVIAVLFIYLFARTVQENASSTRSPAAALIGSIADGFGLIALTLGVFGLLMALVLGVLVDVGPRLAGESLTATLLWSAALIAIGVLLIFASGGIRRIGGRARA